MSAVAPIGEALERAAEAATLLVATDYDGVLAPFDADPMKATPVPGAIDTLRSLAGLPGVHVAVVSGRDLATLRTLTEIGEDEPIVLIGSHGAESSSPAVREAMEAAAVTPDDEATLAELRSDIEALVKEHHPDAGIEHKSAAVVVHVRGLPRDVGDAAIADARRVALDHPGVKVLKGKSVLELSVSPRRQGLCRHRARSPRRRRRAHLPRRRRHRRGRLHAHAPPRRPHRQGRHRLDSRPLPRRRRARSRGAPPAPLAALLSHPRRALTAATAPPGIRPPWRQHNSAPAESDAAPDPDPLNNPARRCCGAAAGRSRRRGPGRADRGRMPPCRACAAFSGAGRRPSNRGRRARGGRRTPHGEKAARRSRRAAPAPSQRSWR